MSIDRIKLESRFYLLSLIFAIILIIILKF
jgi:hypothetical protein